MPPPRAPLENTPSGNWRTPEGLKLDPNGRILGFGGGGPSGSIPGAGQAVGAAAEGAKSVANRFGINALRNGSGAIKALGAAAVPAYVAGSLLAPEATEQLTRGVGAGINMLSGGYLGATQPSALDIYRQGFNQLQDPSFQAGLQGMTPEQQHSAILPHVEQMIPHLQANIAKPDADLIKNLAGQDGKLSMPEVQHLLGMPGGEQIQAQIGPEKAQSLFQNMDPTRASLLAIGVPLAVMGLFQSFGGSGGLGSLLTMILGGGAAAYGLGAFDEAPKAPQRNDDLFHQTQVALSDRPEAAEAQDALAYQNYGRLGVPAARAYRMFNPEGLKDMIRQKAKDELARRASQLDM